MYLVCFANQMAIITLQNDWILIEVILLIRYCWRFSVTKCVIADDQCCALAYMTTDYSKITLGRF